MRIAWRFGLLVSVLLVFAAAFAGVILYQTSGQQLAIDRLRDLVTVAGRAGALGQELQKERAAAAWVVVSGGSGQRDGFVQQTRSTIDAADRYERLRRGLLRLLRLQAPQPRFLLRVEPGLRDEDREQAEHCGHRDHDDCTATHCDFPGCSIRYFSGFVGVTIGRGTVLNR